MQELQKKFDLCGEFDENFPPIDAGRKVKLMEVFSVWILPLIFMAAWPNYIGQAVSAYLSKLISLV
jgi:hypothetical protein